MGHSVRLVLTAKTEVNGIIANIGTENCGIGMKGSGQVQTIAYSQIREYHDGRLSKKAEIATGV